MVDGRKNLVGLVVIDNSEDGATQWKAHWSPPWFGKSMKERAQLIEDPIIVEALEQLVLLFNKSNPCLMMADKEWARDVLYILKAKGHSVGPTAIKSWAIEDGWTLGIANDLAKIAKKTFNSKSAPNLSIVPNAEERYRRWCRSVTKRKVSILE